jgi:osmotically-inducible protein OsmY
MSPLFKTKQDDKKVVSQIQHALSIDPRIINSEHLEISIKSGVVTIAGSAHTESEKNRVEEIVRNTLRTANFKYNLISNQVRLV